MMRSLSSAVGGLRSHQTKMDVIGNNIANVNTYGFKASRVTFSDVYYQTLSGGNTPIAGSTGGTNPTQIGYGAAIASIDVLNSPSGMASTDRSMDIYISGDGFIATQDASGVMRYSRLGALYFDAEGYLVDVNGNYIMGFPMDADGNPVINPDGTIDAAQLSTIQMDVENLSNMTSISISQTGEITGILPGDRTVEMGTGVPNWVTSVGPASDPTYVSGDISVAMEYRYTASGTTNENWITDIQALNNSDLDGTYTFSYDDTTKTMMAINSQNGDVLTGTYVRNGTFDMKRNGKSVATVTTNTTAASSFTGQNVTFAEQRWLTMSAVDQGGNKIEAEVEYNGQTSVTLGGADPSQQVTIGIDPGAVETGEITVASGGTRPDWLLSVYADPDSDLPAGALNMVTGMNANANTRNATGTLSWLNSTANEAIIQSILDQYATSGNEGSLTMELKTTTTGSAPYTPIYNLEITYPDGTTETQTVVRGTGVTLASGQVLSLTNAEYDALAADTGVADIITEMSAASNPTNPSDYTWPLTAGAQTVGSVSGLQKTIQLYDSNGDFIGEQVYTGGKTMLNIGGINLYVDPDLIALDNAGLFANLMSNGGTSTTIANLSKETVELWEYDGKIGKGKAGEGEKITIGVIALANIANPGGLVEDGNSYFVEGNNSGAITYTKPSLNGTGATTAGYLESSNVDISNEFTNMITTQRGFQANSRIITVSDEMLNELVNLKR